MWSRLYSALRTQIHKGNAKNIKKVIKINTLFTSTSLEITYGTTHMKVDGGMIKICTFHLSHGPNTFHIYIIILFVLLLNHFK